MEGFIASLPTMAVNAGVFVGMVIVTILGGKFALKAKEPELIHDPSNVIIGGLLQDNVSAMMMTEAQRVLAERTGTNTHCVERLTDAIREMTSEVERLNRNLENDRRERR